MFKHVKLNRHERCGFLSLKRDHAATLKMHAQFVEPSKIMDNLK